MAARKPKPWSPPAGLKIEVGVSRGDLFMKAESTPAEAANVARLLTAMVRLVTDEAPDLLPHADSVPGVVIGYDWAEEYAEYRKTPQPPSKKLGF
jgi:hypothetical protein